MIALSSDGRTIRLRKDRLNFFRIQIAWRMNRCLLCRDVHDFGTLRDCRRLSARYEAEESSQSRQAAITRADSVSAFLFRILQECTYVGSSEVGQHELGDCACTAFRQESKEQAPSVTV